MDKAITDLKEAVDGVTNGIDGMEKAVAGMDIGIADMKKAIASQETAIEQLNSLYDQLVTRMGQTMPPGAAYQGNADGDQPAGTMPTGVGDKSILDMIPQDVKAKIPAESLEQLKDVKTPADLKAKIESLENAKKTLTSQVAMLTKQREETLAKINETSAKRKEMLEAIFAIEGAKADINDTINKMTALENAVPAVFEEANENYLAEIDKLAPQIEAEFQNTLNVGFRQIYLATGICALIGMVLLIFYRKRNTIES